MGADGIRHGGMPRRRDGIELFGLIACGLNLGVGFERAACGHVHKSRRRVHAAIMPDQLRSTSFAVYVVDIHLYSALIGGVGTCIPQDRYHYN